MEKQNVNEEREKYLQFDRNRREMKFLSRIYTIIFLLTAAWTFSIVLYSLLDSVRAALAKETLLVHFFGGMLFPIAYFLCTTMASVNKSQLLTLVSPIFPGVGLVIGQGCENDIIATMSFAIGPASLIMCALMIYAGRRYDWLSRQDGFPHFQQLLEEQQQIYRGERENPVSIPKTYEEVRRMKDGSDMDEISASSADIAPKHQEKNNYMDEI